MLFQLQTPIVFIQQTTLNNIELVSEPKKMSQSKVSQKQHQEN